MNPSLEFVFVFSQLNTARGAALVRWMKARTFFFIPVFIISLLFLLPNYLARGLQRGSCAASGCKPSGMSLNALIKVHHIARLLPSCCSLPGVVWFQMKVGLMKPWRHSQGFRLVTAKPGTFVSSLVGPISSPSLYKFCNFDGCCRTADGLPRNQQHFLVNMWAHCHNSMLTVFLSLFLVPNSSNYRCKTYRDISSSIFLIKENTFHTILQSILRQLPFL